MLIHVYNVVFTHARVLLLVLYTLSLHFVHVISEADATEWQMHILFCHVSLCSIYAMTYQQNSR